MYKNRHNKRKPNVFPNMLAAASLLSAVPAVHSDNLQLEEVIVSAQKTEQSIQDVSISVAVVNGDDISKKSVVNMEELTASLPAVTVAKNVLSQYVFMRGIGTPGISPGSEQAVAMFSDGIYLGRPTMARAPLMDISRIEVLRGPQSIFFGKNALAGAIASYTADPTATFEGSASVLFEPEHNEREVRLVLSGPLTDSLSGRLALRKYRLDGWMEDALTGNDGPDQDDSTLRFKLQWEASDSLTLKTSYERNKFETSGTIVETGHVAPWAPASSLQAVGLASLITGGVPIKQDDVTTINNQASRDRIIALGGLGLSPQQLATLPAFETFNDGTTDLFTLSAYKDFDDRSLTLLYGYAGFESLTECACGQMGGLPTVDALNDEEYDQHSVEARLESSEFESVDYLVGFFYQKSNLDFYENDNFGLSLFNPLVPNLSRDMTLSQDSETYSVFGSVTWAFTDAARLVLGARYLNEEKDGKHNSRNFPTGLSPEIYDALQAGGDPTAAALDQVYAGLMGSYEHTYKLKFDDDVVSWLVKLEYDLNYDTMLYASVSNGNKAGGFDARNVGPNTAAGLDQWNFDAEEALNYEAGIKQTLMDGRLRFNATVFQTTVEDYQVAIYTPPVNFYVDNAAELRSRGVELESQFKATEHLTTTLSLAYLDSEWQSFEDAPCTEQQKVQSGGLCATQDLTGERNIFSPEWAGSLTLNYRLPIGSAYVFDSVLGVNYTSEYATDADMDPNTFYDSYTTVDLRIAFGDIDDKWNVALVGKNLTDEIKGNSRTDVPFLPGVYFSQTDRTQSVAIQGTYNF